jgi:hypothetical protein
VIGEYSPMTHAPSEDQDRLKGALEQEEKNQPGNTSMQGQLGHRDQDPMLKAADSDFPEPGESPEHSGEPEDPTSSSLDEVA